MAKSVKWREQRFWVRGVFGFTVVKEDLTESGLKRFIRAADAASPWKVKRADGKPLPSIKRMTLTGEQEFAFSNVVYTMVVEPPRKLLAQQLPAYQRYLTGLMERLLAAGVPGVDQIDMCMSITTDVVSREIDLYPDDEGADDAPRDEAGLMTTT